MLRRYVALSFVTLATVGLAVGCSSDSSDEAVMRATLSGDGCRYEGETTPAPGTFAIDVRNDTNTPASFALMMLPKGATLKDVQTSFDQARQTWQKTGRYVLRRPVSWVTSTRLAPHAASELPVNMFRRARLALICAPWNERPFDLIVVAELNVASDG
jgi:hypothetical protein